MIDKNLSLIQIAALYGSIKIFKFLWLQKEIILNHNLLSYAYYGCNFEIIHLCEQRCSHERVCVQPIVLYRNDLLDYYLENYGNKIEENDEEVKNKTINFVEDENNFYKYLNYECLLNAIFAFNVHVIKNCLTKIVYIVKNVELNNDYNYSRNNSFLANCEYEIDLFKFLYFQKNNEINVLCCPCFFDSLIYCLEVGANDAFKFLFFELNEGINFKFTFMNAIESNHEMANFMLDLQFKEKEANTKNSILFFLYNHISFDDIIAAIKFYNEDVVVKMIKLYDYAINMENIKEFVSKLMESLSTKMIYSLINKLLPFFPAKLMLCASEIFESNNHFDISNLIKEKIVSTYT